MFTIPATLRTTARRTPEREALLFEGRLYTYAELDAEVDRTAQALIRQGLKPGERLALMAPNSDGFVITIYAALRAGAIVIPVNPASAAPEVVHILSDSGAAVLVFAPAVSPTVATAEGIGLPATLQRTLALGQVDAHADLSSLAEDEEAQEVQVQVDEDDDALILYTSGTTGRPKGVLLDHRRMMIVAFTCVSACGMKVHDRFLHVAPLYHAAELGIMLIPGTILGAKHIVMPAFDPKAVASTMERERVTMFFGPPTMYQLLLGVEGVADLDLSSWRTGLFGAAPMPAATAESLLGTFPGVEFMSLAGQTEAGPGGIYSSGSQVQERPDASGRQALPFTEARVVDAEDEEVSPGQVGELVLRGETIMKGYWNRPEETAAALRGGWLRTGDLVRVDDDGYMTIVDRLKDLIITGGQNVYSAEVENVLAGHDDVADVAVVARPHEVYGESIVAVVTPRPDATVTLEGVKEFCAPRLARYKVPHDLVIAPIPRNRAGKVLKHELRQSLA